MAEYMDGARWYVAHTYSGYENKVKTNLEKIVENRGLQDKIFDIQIPTVIEIVQDGEVTKEVESKVFPSYVMIKMIMTDETWHVVRNITGVTGFVGMGNKAVPLGEDEVKFLLRQAGEDDPRQFIDYEVGDSVEILDGSFAGIVGKVAEIDSEKGKIVVTTALFGGRETPIDLEYHQVRKV